MKKTFAIITPAKFPGSSGDTANFLEIINQLTSEDIKVVLICPKDGNGDKNQISAGVEIIRIPCKPPRLKDVETGVGRWQVIKLLYFLLIESFVVIWTLKHKKIKSVFMRHSILTLQLPFILRSLGAKVVADGELASDLVTTTVGPLSSRIMNWYEKRAIQKYSYFKVSTKPHAESIVSLGFPEDRIVIIPVSINIDRVPKYDLREIPAYSFGYFGVLEKWQGIDILIEGFRILVKKIPSATLYIIGEGSMSETLKKTVENYELSNNILFVGAITRETLWGNYFKKFQIVVIPRPKQNSSIDYVLPIKLIESLAAGKSVVAMDIPIMHDVPENAIMLASSCTSAALAESMEKLSSDPLLLQQLSTNGRTFVSKYDIKTNIQHLITLFDED